MKTRFNLVIFAAMSQPIAVEIKNYCHQIFTEKKITASLEQIQTIELIAKLCQDNLQSKPFKITDLLKQKAKIYSGLYLYGSVGSGKTLIIETALDSLKNTGLSWQKWHYRELIDWLNIKFSNCPSSLSHAQELQTIVKNIAKNYRIIFIDEFDVMDIVESVLIKNFLLEIFKYKILCLFTSNVAPENLYQNGLQRSNFLPLIKALKEECLTHTMPTEKDYRSTKKNNNFEFKSQASLEKLNAELNDKFLSSCDEKHIERGIMLNNRFFNELIYIKNSAFCSFNNLCRNNLYSADYRVIFRSFKTFFISGWILPTQQEIDVIRRMIAMVDELYLSDVKLYCNFNYNLSELNNLQIKEIKRCSSRLQELASR